jgi:AraC-like DNA-binding protein
MQPQIPSSSMTRVSILLPETLKAAELSPVRRKLSTSVVAEGDRFAYWMDMVCAVYANLECDPPEQAQMFGEIEFSSLGALDLTEVRSSVPRVRRTPNQIRRDSRDACLVQIQRVGRSMVCQDGREAVLAPGDFVLYDTSRPYDLSFEGAEHDLIVVRLPRSALDLHVLNLHDLTATTVPGTCAAGHLMLTMVDTLQRDIDRLHPSSAVSLSEAITSMIAAGLRGLPGANNRKQSNLSAFHVARVKAYLTEHLRDPELTVASIAAAMRMSADHLSRLFRNEPVPLSRMIWQLRLDACRRELCDPRLAHRRISEIAFAWGFNDATHFGRSFREHFGVTPREWRQQSLESPSLE